MARPQRRPHQDLARPDAIDSREKLVLEQAGSAEDDLTLATLSWEDQEPWLATIRALGESRPADPAGADGSARPFPARSGPDD